jgi:hypothetical protein
MTVGSGQFERNSFGELRWRPRNSDDPNPKMWNCKQFATGLPVRSGQDVAFPGKFFSGKDMMGADVSMRGLK